MVKTLLLGLLMTAVSFAADAVGKWSGSVHLSMDGGETREETVLLIFRMEGDKLTGSGGSSEDGQRPFDKVKLVGDTLTFTVLDGEVSADASMKLDGDSMKGEARVVQEGRKMVARFDLKRSKV